MLAAGLVIGGSEAKRAFMQWLMLCLVLLLSLYNLHTCKFYLYYRCTICCWFCSCGCHLFFRSKMAFCSMPSASYNPYPRAPTDTGAFKKT